MKKKRGGEDTIKNRLCYRADATWQLQGQRAKENVVQILLSRGHRL